MAEVRHLLISALIIVIAVIGKTYQSPVVEGRGNLESGDNAIGKYNEHQNKTSTNRKKFV